MSSAVARILDQMTEELERHEYIIGPESKRKCRGFLEPFALELAAARGLDDEPSFTVRASDPLAVTLVEASADLSIAAGVPPERVVAARSRAAEMRAWLERNSREEG